MAIMPDRFNSISEPVDGSIIPDGFGSTTSPVINAAPTIWKPGDPSERIGLSFLSWITPDIAISSYETACDPEALRIEGIRTVISIGSFQAHPRDPSIVHEGFPFIEDATTNISEVDAISVLKAIRHGVTRGKTLVHCAAGISRSPGFVTLHLAMTRGIPWDEARGIVHRGRAPERIHPLTEARLKQLLTKWRSS